MIPIEMLEDCYQETLSNGTTYWVSPQCADCGEVVHADTLEQLATEIADHYCD